MKIEEECENADQTQEVEKNDEDDSDVQEHTIEESEDGDSAENMTVITAKLMDEILGGEKVPKSKHVFEIPF